MNVTHGTAAPPLSKKWDGNTIQNPHMVGNKFTPVNADKALSILHLKGDEKINELKEVLKKYDFTNITGNELRDVGDMLYANGLLDKDEVSIFRGGRGAFDEEGKAARLDEKFNAIALFYEGLEGTLSVSRNSPESKLDQQEGYQSSVRTQTRANQVINALVYFSRSERNDLSVRETA